MSTGPARKRKNAGQNESKNPKRAKIADHNFKNIDDFERLEKLGEGTYGVVTKALHEPSGTMVALKKVKLDMEEEGIPSTTIREVSLLKRLKHPNVVRLYECIHSKGNLYLVFEIVEMDLQKYLKQNCPLHVDLVRDFSFALVQGVVFFHSQGILHRDLKPQNLLIDPKTKTLKIADLGLGREHGIPIFTITHEVVTLWYRCPEILMGTKIYGGGVDTWSAGSIIAELFRHTEGSRSMALFRGDSEIDQLFQIFKQMGTPNKHTWPTVVKLKDWKTSFPRWKKCQLSDVVPRAGALALDLIGHMLKMDPLNRVVAKHALMHPWFENINPDLIHDMKQYVGGGSAQRP